MENEKIQSELTNVFRDVFHDPTLELSDALGASDIEGWDSLNHVVLISTIEERFGVKFKLKDLMSIENVGDIRKLLATKTDGGV
jgi:acyl carrier protein